jgi:hypothetical protein
LQKLRNLKVKKKLEDKYKQKGMSDDEAEIAAYRNQRAKKIALGIGAAALAAATVYAVHSTQIQKCHELKSRECCKWSM